MICPACGAPNHEDDRFCIQCGAGLAAAAAPSPAQPSTCPACSYAFTPEQNFCDNCGRPRPQAPRDTLQSAAPPSPPTPPPAAPAAPPGPSPEPAPSPGVKSGGNSLRWLVLGVAGFLLTGLVIAGGVWLFRSVFKGKPDPSRTFTRVERSADEAEPTAGEAASASFERTEPESESESEPYVEPEPTARLEPPPDGVREPVGTPAQGPVATARPKQTAKPAAPATYVKHDHDGSFKVFCVLRLKAGRGWLSLSTVKSPDSRRDDLRLKSSQIKEIKKNRIGPGAVNSFHIKLKDGRNYNLAVVSRRDKPESVQDCRPLVARLNRLLGR